MLTSKQRAYLRSIAHTEDAILQIGKGGINENVIQQADDALEAREVIKVRVLKNATLSLREVAEVLARETGAHTIQQIGNVVLLYRKSQRNPRIQLP